MNTALLKQKISTQFSMKDFADRVNMDESTLYRKLSSGRFTIKEANCIVDTLKLNLEEANSIFFNDKLA